MAASHEGASAGWRLSLFLGALGLALTDLLRRIAWGGSGPYTAPWLCAGLGCWRCGLNLPAVGIVAALTGGAAPIGLSIVPGVA